MFKTIISSIITVALLSNTAMAECTMSDGQALNLIDTNARRQYQHALNVFTEQGGKQYIGAGEYLRQNPIYKKLHDHLLNGVKEIVNEASDELYNDNNRKSVCEIKRDKIAEYNDWALKQVSIAIQMQNERHPMGIGEIMAVVTMIGGLVALGLISAKAGKTTTYSHTTTRTIWY